MGNFVRGNPSNWGFNEKLSSAEMNLTDAQWPDAVNGGGGGTYTPSALLTFLGANGFLFNCAITFGVDHNPVSNSPNFIFDNSSPVIRNGGLLAIEATAANALIECPNFVFDNSSPVIRNGGILAIESTAGTSTIEGPVTFDVADFLFDTACNSVTFKTPNVFVDGGMVSFLNGGSVWMSPTSANALIQCPNFVFDNSSPVIRNGGLLAIEATAGNALIECPNFIFDNSSPVIRNGGLLSVESTAGTSVIQAPWENWKTLTMKGTTGRLCYRYVFGVNADHEYGPANTGVSITPADVVIVKTGTLTASHRYIANQTGCTGGEVITFVNEDAASHTLNVTQADGSTLIAALTTGAGGYLTVTIINDGLGNNTSSWHVLNATGAGF